MLADVHCRVVDFDPVPPAANVPRWSLYVVDRSRDQRRLTLWGSHTELDIRVGTTLLMINVEVRYKTNPRASDGRLWLNFNA